MARGNIPRYSKKVMNRDNQHPSIFNNDKVILWLKNIEKELSLGKIAKTTGVSIQKVKHIKHHRTWNDISSLYNF